MIPIQLLINIGVKYVLPLIVIATVLYVAYDWAYDRGYRAREAIAVKAERDILKAKQKLITKRVKEEKALRELDKQHLNEVLNAERERNKELLDDIANLSNKRMFVNVKRKPAACDRERMHAGGDTGSDAGETGRFELFETTQQDIQRYGIDVQQIVNRYLTLVDFIEKNQGECLKIIK